MDKSTQIFEDLGGISVKTVYAALPTLDWMKAHLLRYYLVAADL